MLRLTKPYSTLLYISPIAIIAAFLGCSTSGGNSGGTGGQATTGDTSGASGGVSGNTGGVSGNTGGVSGNTGGVSGNGTGGASGDSGGGSTGGNGGGTGGDDGGGTGGTSAGGGGVVPGTSKFDCSPATGTVPALKATAVVTTGLKEPMLVAYEPGGDSKRLFVLERAGKLRIIDSGALVATPFLDYSSKVVAGMGGADERGALGFAFHPDYATNGLFYVHYNDKTSSTGDSILEEYKVSADKNVADAASGRVVLKVTQPDNGNAAFRNHKGGAINFGKDGFLYMGLGDGGGSGDNHGATMGNGQNVGVLLGKMLRINPVKEGDKAYTTPAGNLKDTMSTAAPEVWDYGFRNPFRSTFDGCTGDLYIGDVGQDKWEEIDIEKAGEGGKNYGWNTMEGTHCYPPTTTTCTQTGMTLPVHDYDRQAGQSVTGGAVYRGAAIPALHGTYIYADYGSGTIWSMVYDRAAGTVSTPVSLAQDLSNVSSVVAITNGADGEIYLTSLGGGIYKLESAE